MKKGFTTIEIFIVVIVMMILVGITGYQFMNSEKKARDVQRKSDINAVSKALRAYANDYGKFPSIDEKNGLDINKLWGKSFVDNGYVYLKQMPRENYYKDLSYCYSVGKSGKHAQLFTELENKNDSECLENFYSCSGRNYCYTEIIFLNKSNK